MTEKERRKIRQLVDESLAAARLREAGQREELTELAPEFPKHRIPVRKTG
jgi:hypothetical protein